MDYDFKWLDEIGLDTKSGKEYTGGQTKYISALQRFYKGFDKNSASLDSALVREDYDSYMITVHALKSNAKMIGAPELSVAFAALEDAAREGRTDTIREDSPGVIMEYGNLVKKLAPIGEIGEFHAADEISGEEAKQVAQELLEALDDFDDDRSKELVIKLSGYPFRLTQKEILKTAKEYIEDFLYDEAAYAIKEIVPAIE
ncbi:MAG: Hpt domain-containing protein [Eubacterium sp.]|nr:Hpt domain-containing protein [Eubacterium sp.]